MAEKIDSMEIHPMRGHSRGEWYCSLDDIAPSEDEAEYWAVFGVTHRGNRHCLGEFLTKSDAQFAVDGIRTRSSGRTGCDLIDGAATESQYDWFLFSSQ